MESEARVTKRRDNLIKIILYFLLFSSCFFSIGLFTWLPICSEYLNIFLGNSIYFYTIISPIPAFAFVALIVKLANSLKFAKWKTLLLMLGLNVFGMAPALFASNFGARLIIITVLSSIGIFLAFVVSNLLWKFLKGKSELYFQILCVALSIPFIFSAYFSGLTIQKRALATFFHSKVKVSEYVISDKFVFPYWQSARAEILKRCDFRDFSKELDSVRKCRFEKTKDGKKELSFALGYWSAVFSFGIEGAQDIEESNLYFNNSGFLLPCGKSGEKEFISANFKSTSDGRWSASAKIYVYRGGKIIKKYQLSGDELIKKVAAAEARIDEIRAMWRANSQKRK